MLKINPKESEQEIIIAINFILCQSQSYVHNNKQHLEMELQFESTVYFNVVLNKKAVRCHFVFSITF